MNIYEAVTKFLQVYPNRHRLGGLVKFTGEKFEINSELELTDLDYDYANIVANEVNIAFECFLYGAKAFEPVLDIERVVCAANKYYDPVTQEGVTFLGARHCDDIMYDAITNYEAFYNIDIVRDKTEVQGFWTNRHRFLTRTEAFEVAKKAGQIIRRVGGDTTNGGTLYSENLY